MLDNLKKVYELYDEVMRPFDVVCRKGCASCCTCNVILTSLEGRFLFDALNPVQEESLINAIKNRFPEKRYIPKVTINQFASMCMNREEPVDAENNPDWGRCPLLRDNACSVYHSRPLGCRVQLSEIDCRKTGYAQVPSLMITINNVFQQYVEHLDSSGITGNLSDLLLFLGQAGKTDPDRLKQSREFAEQLTGGYLILNRRMPVLIVPPEHQSRIRELMIRLTRIQGG